uniref:Uncharacterized protein n=1 Tax=Anguilla anguilla TaxID=7936 RepID=A0A0E9WNM9_ANGAN
MQSFLFLYFICCHSGKGMFFLPSLSIKHLPWILYLIFIGTTKL